MEQSNNEFDIPSIIFETFAYVKQTPKAYMLKISPPPPPIFREVSTTGPQVKSPQILTRGVAKDIEVQVFNNFSNTFENLKTCVQLCYYKYLHL